MTTINEPCWILELLSKLGDSIIPFFLAKFNKNRMLVWDREKKNKFCPDEGHFQPILESVCFLFLCHLQHQQQNICTYNNTFPPKFWEIRTLFSNSWFSTFIFIFVALFTKEKSEKTIIQKKMSDGQQVWGRDRLCRHTVSIVLWSIEEQTHYFY